MTNLLLQALWETIYMVGIATVFACAFGIPMGLGLVIWRDDGILPHPCCYRVLAFLVNTTRSLPFIILLLLLTPLTRFIVGTSIGTSAAIVPLFVAATPFIGRVVESALREVPQGLIEASLMMGAKPLQLISKVLLPEALPGIIDGITLVIIGLIGYSAMAGTVGGGGLGNVAYNYGYERFDTTIMIITSIVLIVLVQLIQWLGDSLARKLRPQN